MALGGQGTPEATTSYRTARGGRLEPDRAYGNAVFSTGAFTLVAVVFVAFIATVLQLSHGIDIESVYGIRNNEVNVYSNP